MSEEEALKLGYVSSYACAGPDEDFVEMIARIAVFGPEWYEKKVARAKELYLNATSALDFAYDPSEALRQKETIVQQLTATADAATASAHGGSKGFELQA